MNWQSGDVSPFAFKKTGDADFPAHIKALVLGPPKSGKGLKDGTPVLTPGGWRPIESLSVGDHVMGVDGPTKVVGVFPQGTRDIYRVTTDDGGVVECDDQHLWTVHPHGMTPRTESTPTLVERIQENARYAYLPMHEPIQHEEANLPLDPYVMGLLLGDGGFTNTSVMFHKSDPDLHDAISDLLPEGAELGDWSDQHNTARITGLISYIRDLGLAGKSSWEKFIPDMYLRSSISQRLSLLAGLLDTDGGMNGKSTCFYTSSSLLRDGVVDIVRSLGGVATVREKADPAYAYRGEQRMGRVAYNVSVRLPESFGCPFKLLRKVEAWQNGTKKRPPMRRITEIVHVGRAPSTCIKVDTDDGLFITKDYIVTHNTTFLSTFPNVVVADVEAGLMSIAHKNVPYVTIDKTEKLQTLLFVLRDENMRAKAAEQMGLDKIETVGIDTMDALQDLVKRERLASERRTTFEMKDWGFLLDQFREMIRAFVSLPMHVVFSCHTKTIELEEGKIIQQPGLQGAIAEEIAGMVGFSMLMHRTREIDPQTGHSFTSYSLQVEGDDQNPHLGNRAMGRLAGRIEPTFDVLHAAIYDGLQLTKQQQGNVDVHLDGVVEQPQPEATPTPAPAPPAGPGGQPPGDDEPVSEAALQHVERMLGEWGFVLPDDARTWDMGKARMIGRMFVATKDDVQNGKYEGGQEKAKADLQEFLQGVEAWQNPDDTPPTGSVADLIAWVGDDVERAKLAWEREKAGQDRKTASDQLRAILKRHGVKVSTPPPPDTPEVAQETSQESEPASAPEVLTTEQMDAVVDRELGGTPVQEQAPEPAPEPGHEVKQEEPEGNETTPMSKADLMRIDDLADAPPCEATGNPIDDLDIARLSLSRFGRWLCVDAYVAATKSANT